jgi:hypothetical protein
MVFSAVIDGFERSTQEEIVLALISVRVHKRVSEGAQLLTKLRVTFDHRP